MRPQKTHFATIGRDFRCKAGSHAPETGSTLPPIMNIAPLQLARTQFTASLSFLALFLALSMALAWI